MKNIKEFFPIFQKHPSWVYLDSAATTHKPKEVIDAITRFYAEDNATVHRTAYKQAISATEKFHETREYVRAFLHAKSVDEIIFTNGTTDSLNLVARSFAKPLLQEGDEIWISILEHHSNIIPWQILAKETGAKLCYFPIDQEGNLQWKGYITEKTKIISLTHMSNVTATINPIQEIAMQAHIVGAYLIVDGAQSASHMEVDVQALDCDFYAFSGHKCYGPTGVGILYGKKDLLDQMTPLQGGGGMVEQVDLFHTTYQMPPIRFEAGTPNIASIIGLKPALEFIQKIGRKNIIVHEHALLELATQALQDLPGIEILGRSLDKGPILSFSLEGVHPLDVATLLDVKDISIRSGHLCAQPLLKHFGKQTVLRASFGVYNTEEDVVHFREALTEVVAELSRSTVSVSK